MEDLPRNISKDVKRLTHPRTARRSARWTLLLVDETGRTLRVRGFHILAVLAVLLVFGLTLAAGTGFYLLDLARDENQRLRTALTASAEVLGQTPPVESAAPQSSPELTPVPRPAADDDTAPEASPASPGEMPPLASPAPPVSESAPAEAAAPLPPADAPVAVADVSVSREGRFTVRFRLRNVAPGSEALSGHVVVVMEMATGAPRRVAVPAVPLVDGQPTGETPGETFSIQNYRPMRFRAGPGTGDQVVGATAFVFDEAGTLLLEAPLLTERS